MIKDIFSYPMRIFFLLGAVCSMVGGIVFFLPIDFIGLHKFFFLHLVAPLAYAGFLLTGIPDWTKFYKSLKIHTKILFFILIIAILALPFSIIAANIAMWFFWLYLSLLCAYMVWLDRNENQFGIFGFLLLVLGFEAAFILTGEERFLNLQVHVHVIAILLISFRVSLTLGKEALNRESSLENAVFVPDLVYKNIAITCIVVFLALCILTPNSKAIFYAAIACGTAILAKLKEWHFKELLKYHFVIFYYILQLCIGITYIAFGVSAILELGFEINLLHIITINGFLFTIMLIFNIAGLRHSGQDLCFLHLSRLAFVLLFLAGISRGLLANYGFGFFIHLPATLLIISFGLWFWDFYRVFRDNDFSADPE